MDGGVVVQHSPTSSSLDGVPLSKARETPHLLPGRCTAAAHWCAHRLLDGSKAEKNFPHKGIIRIILTHGL